MDKEIGSLTSEMNDIRSKQERSERYDPTALDRLEASVAELNTRVQAGLQASASAQNGRRDLGRCACPKEEEGQAFRITWGRRRR